MERCGQMKIIQIAPLWESVPPERYGGTELVVHLLTEELVKRGHEVTLFASGESKTSAKLIPATLQSLRELFKGLPSPLAESEASIYESKMLSDVFEDSHLYDVIHSHLPYQALAFSHYSTTPILTTLHGNFAPPVLKDLYLKYKHLPYVSISNSQRFACPNLNYLATIYHGLSSPFFTQPIKTFSKKYFAFIGRFSPEKGAHIALKAAKECGVPLILAGKLNEWEKPYFDAEIKPLLDGKKYKMIGEINFLEKKELLSNAVATLFPIQWAEPFGLVVIESMACGTPVIALNNGSIPELIEHGLSGFIANNYPELVKYIHQIDQLDRNIVYTWAFNRFTVERMADQYLKTYQELIVDKHETSRARLMKRKSL